MANVTIVLKSSGTRTQKDLQILFIHFSNTLKWKHMNVFQILYGRRWWDLRQKERSGKRGTAFSCLVYNNNNSHGSVPSCHMTSSTYNKQKNQTHRRKLQRIKYKECIKMFMSRCSFHSFLQGILEKTQTCTFVVQWSYWSTLYSI